MKHKHILLTTALLIVLTGCGGTNNKLYDVDSETKKIIIENKINEYLFSTLEEKKGDISWEGTPREGVLSSSTKRLIKQLWMNLESLGFSGYDPALLEQNGLKVLIPTYDVIMPAGGLELGDIFKDKEYRSLPFHTRVIDMLMYRHLTLNMGDSNSSPYTGYNRIFIGLTYKNQYVYLAQNGPLKKASHPGAIERPSYILNLSDTKPDFVNPKPGIPVSENLIKEWNQVFIDTLKADPFFKQFFEAPAAPSDTSGNVSSLAALKGKSGVDATQLTMNGVSGSQVDLGVPMYVQLKGSVDHGKSSTSMTGLVAYKLGNSVLGVVQSYSNSGTGFNADSRHTESSIIAAHAFGSFVAEAQLGSVYATDVNFHNWSGVRSQVKLGIYTSFGAPFVQLTHRDFGSTSDTAAYAGFEIANAEFKADTYSFSTSLLTKVGHHSVHGVTGSMDWTAALKLNSGVTFNTSLALGSAFESKAAFNVSLDH